MPKITSASPQQWEEIAQIREDVLARQTVPIDVHEAEEVIGEIYADIGRSRPMVEMCPSPRAALLRANQLACEKGCELPSPYHSYWMRCWDAWYAGAQILGVQFDARKLSMFRRWAKSVPVCFPFADVVIVSQNPIEIHWQGRILHCLEGPSVLWSDGDAIYSIQGVRVNEQVVMRPETLTVRDIVEEQNQEVKRIMASRYGYDKVLKDLNAQPIDVRTNHVDGTQEALFSCEELGMRMLVCSCPSKGEPFFLECDPSVNTCEEAQVYLSNGLSSRTIGSS